MRFTLGYFLSILFLFPLGGFAQDSKQQGHRRVALIIGNSNYVMGQLSNPVNDARAMKKVLDSLRFEVMEFENVTQVQMKMAIDEFGKIAEGAEAALFYYAGHGIQSKGINYLIPIDAVLKIEQEIEYECVQTDRVLALMAFSRSQVNIIILDACRNNPFERSWSRSVSGNGLAVMVAPSGTLIAYATSPGNTASDGYGMNGLYTSAIIECIGEPGVSVIKMFQEVRKRVIIKSNGEQTPWESTSLTGDFYFNPDNSRLENSIKTQTSESKGIDYIEPKANYIIDQRDNEKYAIVKIGSQIWMAENLRAIVLNDRTVIPIITEGKYWGKAYTPACCYYMNQKKNAGSYGVLYNWYTVQSGKLCPTGWHVPSDQDWEVLINEVGGEAIAGGHLKEIGFVHWSSPNYLATDKVGFAGLPGGYRLPNGSFCCEENYGFYWSSTEFSSDAALFIDFYYASNGIGKNDSRKSFGFSVRCIKD
jgi:uncharacterized protein (TIGR02145 family)